MNSVFFLLLFFGFNSYLFLPYLFFSWGILDPNLRNLKLGDRPQFWPVLTPGHKTGELPSGVKMKLKTSTIV